MTYDITKKIKQRDSNMELLRVVTMCMIVFLHLDIFLLEEPHFFNCDSASYYIILFNKSLTIISVNVFIMLSGWYGIKMKWERFIGLWFQVFFFMAIGLLCYFIYTGQLIHLKVLIKYILLMDGSSYEFFQSYTLLYLFSPMLNLYAEKANKKNFITFLCVFFLIQFLWGCLSWGYVYFGNGYSVISYMGIYLFARYTKIHHLGESVKSYQWIIIYIMLSLLGSTLAFIGGRDNHIVYNIAFSYASPIIILSSFSFLYFFSTIKLHSKKINWIAKHSFAVYLFHMNIFILPNIIFTCKIYETDKNLNNFFLIAIITCILIYIISVLLDICRLNIWNKIVNIINITRK